MEFLYSSNVANPCSIDMAITTMPLFIALFGSLVYDDMKCQLKPIPVSMADRSYHCHGNRKMEYVCCAVFVSHYK